MNTTTKRVNRGADFMQVVKAIHQRLANLENSRLYPNGPLGTIAEINDGGGPGSATATTTETALYTLDSIALVAGRRYRISGFWVATPSGTSTSAVANILIRTGIGTSGASVAKCTEPHSTTGVLTFLAVGEFVGGSDVSTSVTQFTMTAQAGTGTLTPTAISNVGNRPYIILEDIGT